jgi:hypothetical protein
VKRYPEMKSFRFNLAGTAVNLAAQYADDRKPAEAHAAATLGLAALAADLNTIPSWRSLAAQLYGVRAGAFEQQKQWADALRAADEALRLGPEEAELRNIMQHLRGRVERAQKAGPAK